MCFHLIENVFLKVNVGYKSRNENIFHWKIIINQSPLLLVAFQNKNQVSKYFSFCNKIDAHKNRSWQINNSP